MQAHSTEVAGLSALPSLPFALLALGGALAGAGLSMFGVATKRDKAWRGFRVMPIVAVVVLFVDMFVLSSSKSPFSSNARASVALDLFEQRAMQLATTASVPSDERTLEPVVKMLGPVPWLVKGEALPEWSLKLFYGCSGPQLDAAGLGAGTLLYCVDTARTQAWVTLVGLPYEQRFGAPQLVTQGGAVLTAVIHTLPPADDEAPPSFTPEADAGTLTPP
jgi:hypothetical protein